MSEGGYQAGEVAAWGDGAKAYICDRLGEVGAAEAAIFGHFIIRYLER